MTPMAKYLILLALISLLILTGFTIIGPIEQNPAYHQFADQRTMIGLPNALNVLSNIAFLMAGLYGLLTLRHLSLNRAYRLLSQIFFIGLILTSVGSAYYHLSPTNETLVWDRIPMTVSFATFCSFIIAAFIKESAGRKMLWLLLPVSISSVLYWGYSERMGQGDLRFYLLVQFLPLMLTPLVLWLSPRQQVIKKSIWIILVLYTVAKVAEYYDGPLFLLLGMSGHTVKHLISALTGIVFVTALSLLAEHRHRH